MFIRFLILLFSIFLHAHSEAEIAVVPSEKDFTFDEEKIEELLEKGITVDLKNPILTDGVLTTDEGGVVTGPDIRIQAIKIRYSKQKIDNKRTATIEAEGNVMVEMGGYILVGDKIFYDFETKKGCITHGITEVEPWFFGGETIEICPDGSYIFHNGFVTTSEVEGADWKISVKMAKLNRCNDFAAKDVVFRFLKFPIFSLPSFKINLNSIFDSPFRYHFRLGGHHGPRVTVIYELMNWRCFKSFLRLDYRFNQGPGGGIVTEYKSRDGKHFFRTINYLAKDKSYTSPEVYSRYRFQGMYYNCLYNDKFTIDATYDKFSDQNVPTDYYDQGLQLCTGQRTQIHFRREETNWIGNLTTHVRVNTFQTVSQEIPTWDNTWRPIVLGSTGIVSDMRFQASYLNFVYGNNSEEPVNDYNSTKVSFKNRMYRPISYYGTTFVPEGSALLIYYGNSPDRTDKWVIMGLFGLSATSHLHRYYRNFKHIVTPYAEYNYYTFPTTDPNNHYIFSIQDGWYRINQLRTGLRNNFYQKQESGCITRFLYLDLYTYTFIDTPTFHCQIPKLYADIVANPFPTLSQTLGTAWNFYAQQLDYINFKILWTVNENIALSGEYRHRGPYDWRKADVTNFILDSFRSVQELRNSELSDKRDTILLHFYAKVHPDWALEFESRHGWNRVKENSYNEYYINLSGRIQSNWHLKVFYRHKEYDDRIGINFNMGVNKPCGNGPCDFSHSVEF